MLIVLIWWRVHNSDDAVKDFFEHWKELGIDGRPGLVGEFLSEPIQAQDLTLPGGKVVPVSDLSPADPRCRTFVNVGIWDSEEAFEAKVGPMIQDSVGSLASWQYGRTTRSFLKPQSWRIGDSALSDLVRDHFR